MILTWASTPYKPWSKWSNKKQGEGILGEIRGSWTL